MMNVLYLHVGHHKTGSSYIQSCLAKNIDLLKINKILYPIGNEEKIKASSGCISSGNGFFLSDPNILHLPELSNYSNYESLLFSREFLLREIAEKSNIENNILNLRDALNIQKIKILLFIRNPLEMISSIYQQQIKRKGFYLDIQHCENILITLFDSILAFINKVQKWNTATLKVINYSYNKDVLLTHVQHWLDLKDNLLTPDKPIVNRSLTKSEAELQKIVNKILGPSGHFLSDSLCEELPNVKSETFSLPTVDRQSILKKIYPVISEINTLIDPEHRLEIEDKAEQTPQNEQLHIFTKEQLEVIGESFSNTINQQKKIITALNNSLENITIRYWLSTKLKHLPKLKNLLKKTISPS